MQEQILFFRLLEENPAPNMAIFLDGVADFCFLDGNPSSWQALASYYNANAGDRQNSGTHYGVITHWEKLREFIATLPLTRALGAFGNYLQPIEGNDSGGSPTSAAETSVSEAVLQQVIGRYYDFVRQVEAVANAYRVQPIFVWQPIPLYRYDPSLDPFKRPDGVCQVKSGYPLMKETLVQKPLGSDFVWAADMQQDLHEPLYVDWFHYNAPMSRRLAAFILDTMQDRQLLHVPPHAEQTSSHQISEFEGP
jgi:hypothetical protein